jgi:gluconolactonase
VAAMEQQKATPDHLIACAGKTLNLPTSLSFGGADRRTVYVGSLGLSHLVTFNSPVAGLSLY